MIQKKLWKLNSKREKNFVFTFGLKQKDNIIKSSFNKHLDFQYFFF